jgi:hypothetical protein
MEHRPTGKGPYKVTRRGRVPAKTLLALWRLTMNHLWIPDTQVRDGVPTKHIEALGNYIEEKRFDKIICAGDWWDMPATSNWNSAHEQEGLRVQDDIDSGNRAMHLLWRAVNRRNKKVAGWKKKQYNPRTIFIHGNHEAHLERIWERDPRLHGLVGYDSLAIKQYFDVEVEFKDFIIEDGIAYSHFFYNPMSGRPYSGMIETRLKNIGCSFTQGHAQEFSYGERQLPTGKRLHGLVAGAFYMHDESYKGKQGNAHWRGVIVKHEVRDGEYDLMKVSLDFLLRKYL